MSARGKDIPFQGEFDNCTQDGTSCSISSMEGVWVNPSSLDT